MKKGFMIIENGFIYVLAVSIIICFLVGTAVAFNSVGDTPKPYACATGPIIYPGRPEIAIGNVAVSGV